MQDLRLIGVHEDGAHLLLADDDGTRFTVPLDDAIRAAIRRDRPTLGQQQTAVDGGMRPRDVQAMIRAGLTADEVADRAGWTVEKVHRYEGPILAEREHVATLARQVRLRARAGAHGAAADLDTRVGQRLRSREIDTDTARWDSRRADKGAWTVLLFFNAGGRQREAIWNFDLLARTVTALDDEARWLSDDEEAESAGPLPAVTHPAPAARPSRVYDVEAEGGIDAAPGRRRRTEPTDLVSTLRERSSQRGRRRRPRPADIPVLDQMHDEALPIEELAMDPAELGLPPAAHTHPEDDPEAIRLTPPAPVDEPETVSEPEEQTQDVSTSRVEHQDELPLLDVGDDDDDDDHDDGTVAAAPGPDHAQPDDIEAPDDGVITGPDDGTVDPPAGVPDDRSDDAEAHDAHEDSPDDAPEQPTRPAARKSGRPGVPSWDDIMFGRKGD
ncbi:MAG: septation protein SepH [Terracoccus sp.]